MSRKRKLVPVTLGGIGATILAVNITGNWPPNLVVPNAVGLLLVLVGWMLWVVQRGAFGRHRRIEGWFESLAMAFVTVAACQQLLIRSYSIPSQSMEHTLLVGDCIVAEKVSYGWRVPYTETARLGGWAEPQRGDIVVFRSPTDRNIHWVKRVVGIPGDRVEMRNGATLINEQVETAEYMYIDPDVHEISGIDVILDTDPVTLAAGQYWMLGDNRTGSFDSRYWGPLDGSLIEGKVRGIYWSWDEGPRLERIGKIKAQEPAPSTKKLAL